MKTEQSLVGMIVTGVICFIMGAGLEGKVDINLSGFWVALLFTVIGITGSLYIAVVMIRHQEFTQAKRDASRALIKAMNLEREPNKNNELKFALDTKERDHILNNEYYAAIVILEHYGYCSLFNELKGLSNWCKFIAKSANDSLRIAIDDNYKEIRALKLPLRGYSPWIIYKE